MASIATNVFINIGRRYFYFGSAVDKLDQFSAFFLAQFRAEGEVQRSQEGGGVSGAGLRFRVDDETPHRFVSHRVEERQVVPADATTQDVLQHVAIQE